MVTCNVIEWEEGRGQEEDDSERINAFVSCYNATFRCILIPFGS